MARARREDPAAEETSHAGGPAPLSPREARRRQRIELSREQILDTAEELFSERGYQGTGLKDVAERCEFSVGSIYTFFDSKDRLYEEVLMRRGPGLMEEMRRVVDDGAPANERLITMARLQIENFRRYPAWGRLVTAVMAVGARSAATLPAGFAQAYRDGIDLEAELFAQGQREGVLRAGDPRALARLFSALVTAYHTMDAEISDEPEDFDVEDLLTVITQAFVVHGND